MSENQDEPAPDFISNQDRSEKAHVAQPGSPARPALARWGGGALNPLAHTRVHGDAQPCIGHTRSPAPMQAGRSGGL
jgi:hypothetical protein